jgi:hypothetical protein
MEDFTLAMPISFPRPWPLATKATLLQRQSHEGRIILLIGHTDGHLEVATGRDDYGIEARAHFQQFTVSGPLQGKAILLFSHGANGFELYINREALAPLSQADGRVFAVRQGPELTASYSLDDPGSKSACQKWVDARRSRFANKRPFSPKKPSRSKSLDEQLDELNDAVETLDSRVEDAKPGKKDQTPALAGQLRSLICWPNDRPTWNPLLYRLANDKSLPLPVYSFAVNSSEPEIVKRANYHARNIAPSVRRRAPAEVVMDLQEYMTSTLQTVRSPAGESNISVEETLELTANSLGAAHYDEVIVLDVDLMRMQVFMNTNLLHRVMVGLAETVVVLGRHVLHAHGGVRAEVGGPLM